jgi:hypothetical protein
MSRSSMSAAPRSGTCSIPASPTVSANRLPVIIRTRWPLETRWPPIAVSGARCPIAGVEQIRMSAMAASGHWGCQQKYGGAGLTTMSTSLGVRALRARLSTVAR